MAVTPAGFGRMTAVLLRLAERTAGGRLAIVLEGGYDLTSLREGVREVLKALGTGPEKAAFGGQSPGASGPPSPSLRIELEEALRTFRKKWDIPAA
jgi:hypothetical protein